MINKKKQLNNRISTNKADWKFLISSRLYLLLNQCLYQLKKIMQEGVSMIAL